MEQPWMPRRGESTGETRRETTARDGMYGPTMGVDVVPMVEANGLAYIIKAEHYLPKILGHNYLT